ncbi:hypothetical protein [Burkholderia cenocepacia]|uniref:hypothetical protein n=1 Tax=Burkholderia cenocepacia TaxID=95486 RepID=UPI000761FBC4|nr:hypothetical protein [Burkholderia cenocepacia]KWU19086.1 hypothetical protein AS149_12630 [Burkholderia cenocepacia]
MNQASSFHGTNTGRLLTAAPQIIEIPQLAVLVRHGGELFEVAEGAEDILGAATNGKLGTKAEMTGLSVVASFWTVHAAGYPPSFKPLRADVLAQLGEALWARPELAANVRAIEIVPESVQLHRQPGTNDYRHHVQVRLYGRA